MPQMAPHLEWLDDPAFSVRNLTRAIRRIPNVYGRIAQLGLFSKDYSDLPYIEIDIEKESFSIIPVTPRGTPSPKASGRSNELRTLKVLRIALGDHIDADTLRGRREFGTKDGEMDVMREVNKQFRKISLQHFQTLEFLHWSVLKGDVYNADGTTKLYNVYNIMGETQKTFDFKFGDATDTVDATARQVDYYMEESLQGVSVKGGIQWFCGKDFFERLVTKPEVREAYKFQLGTPNPLRDGVRRVFQHASQTFEVHTGLVSYKRPDGTTITHKFLADDEAIGVPLGTEDVFIDFHGPSDWMSRGDLPYDEVDEWANWLFAKVKPDDDDMGVDIDTQQHVLPMCLHPRLVVRAVSSN